MLYNYYEMVLALVVPQSSWENNNKKCTWEDNLQYKVTCAKWQNMQMYNSENMEK